MYQTVLVCSTPFQPLRNPSCKFLLITPVSEAGNSVRTFLELVVQTNVSFLHVLLFQQTPDKLVEFFVGYDHHLASFLEAVLSGGIEGFLFVRNLIAVAKVWLLAILTRS